MRKTMARSPAYQVMLTALLSLNFGFVLFDRNASSFLMPFIQPDLALNNTQVGLLAGALSLTWSIAALGVGVVSDRTGRSEEHTSELQSRLHLVCRLLLEKKKNNISQLPLLHQNPFIISLSLYFNQNLLLPLLLPIL